MDWIVLGGPGFVVIGSINQQPGVWTSADGRESDVHGLHTHDGDSITRLFAADGALVIAGNVGRNRPSAATWVSQDGVTWDRVADDRGLIGDVAAMVDLADSGILAVGGRWDGATGHPIPLAWPSSWSRFRSPVMRPMWTT